MNAMTAFGRLLWRPMMLLMVFPLLWSILGPALVIDDALERVVLAGYRRGGPSMALLQYALMLGIMLPAAFGLAAAVASLELQFTGMAWTLPALRGRLTTGLSIFALLPAAAVAWLAARAGSLPVGASAFLLAMFWFAATLIVSDAAQPRWLRMVLGALAVVALLEAGAYVSIVTSFPAIAGAAGIAAAAVMLQRHAAPAVMRRRPFIASGFVTGTVGNQRWWAERGGTGGQWAGSLVGASTREWLRAAAYESGGMNRYGWWGATANHALFALLAYALSPGMILMGPFSLAFTGVQLRMNVPYPLSRRQRARLFYLGNLVDVVLLVAVVGAVVFTLGALGAPHWLSDDARMRYEMPTLLALCFVIAPIVQWARARGPLSPSEMQRAGRHLLYPAVAMIVGVPLGILLIRNLATDPARLGLTLLGLGVAAQGLHWVAIQWFYRRADLGTAG